MKKLKEIKNYLKANVVYLWIALFLFISGVFLGLTKEISLFNQSLEEIKKLAAIVAKSSPIGIFLLIFFNNILAILIIIFLGVGLGIIPIFALILNGGILGLVASGEFYPRLLVLVGILPHGIIEIPIFLLAGGLGLKIGKEALKAVFGKNIIIKEDFSFAKSIFLKIILPGLFFSALIETFITPMVINLWRIYFLS